jgi:hypothetical protein
VTREHIERDLEEDGEELWVGVDLEFSLGKTGAFGTSIFD